MVIGKNIHRLLNLDIMSDENIYIYDRDNDRFEFWGTFDIDSDEILRIYMDLNSINVTADAKTGIVEISSDDYEYDIHHLICDTLDQDGCYKFTAPWSWNSYENNQFKANFYIATTVPIYGIQNGKFNKIMDIIPNSDHFQKLVNNLSEVTVHIYAETTEAEYRARDVDWNSIDISVDIVGSSDLTEEDIKSVIVVNDDHGKNVYFSAPWEWCNTNINGDAYRSSTSSVAVFYVM